MKICRSSKRGRYLMFNNYGCHEKIVELKLIALDLMDVYDYVQKSRFKVENTSEGILLSVTVIEIGDPFFEKKRLIFSEKEYLTN